MRTSPPHTPWPAPRPHTLWPAPRPHTPWPRTAVPARSPSPVVPRGRYALNGTHAALTNASTAPAAKPGYAQNYIAMAGAAANGRVAHENGARANVHAAQANAAALRAAIPPPPPLPGTKAAAAAASAAARGQPPPPRPGSRGGTGVDAIGQRPMSGFGGGRPMSGFDGAHLGPRTGYERRAANFEPSSEAAPMRAGRGVGDSAWRMAGSPAPMVPTRHPNADVPDVFCASLSVRSFSQLGL